MYQKIGKGITVNFWWFTDFSSPPGSSHSISQSGWWNGTLFRRLPSLLSRGEEYLWTFLCLLFQVRELSFYWHLYLRSSVQSWWVSDAHDDVWYERIRQGDARRVQVRGEGPVWLRALTLLSRLINPDPNAFPDKDPFPAQPVPTNFRRPWSSAPAHWVVGRRKCQYSRLSAPGNNSQSLDVPRAGVNCRITTYNGTSRLHSKHQAMDINN